MARRGRPPGARNKPRTAPTADGETTSEDNRKPQVAKEPLTDDQQRALFFNHKKLYEARLATFKTAQADLKNAAKLIRAEGTKLDDVKIAIALESEVGEPKIKARIERELRIARWIGAPIGTQFSFLEDRTPIDDKVRDDGKRAGLKGEPGAAPRSLNGKQATIWMDGWHEGQGVLASRIAQQVEDGAEFDGVPLAP